MTTSVPGFGPTSGDLSLRFKLVNAVPVAIVALVIGALVLAGAPGTAPSLATLLARAREYGWAGAGAAVVTVVVLALILEPLELASIRLLEGYWSPIGPLAPLAAAGRWLQVRQRSRLEFISRQSDDASLADFARKALTRWPHETRLLPTSLGNRLRAFEDRAGTAYGLDAVTVWPRLHHALPEDVLATVNQYRNQLDLAARMTLALATCSLTSAGLLVQSPTWLPLPVALLFLAWFSYRAALGAADNYGLAVTAAIDVFRLRLLRTMCVEMPPDTNAERSINDELDLLWRGYDTGNVKYASTDTGQP